MLVFTVILLAILQGLTEFLPISSSGHLFLLPWAFNLPSIGLGFDASIHIGTALALVVFFWKDFVQLIKSKDKLLFYIIIASIPAAVVGFFGDRFIENTFHKSSFAPLVIGIGLIFYGALMYYVDSRAKLKLDVKSMGKKRAIIIGLAQVLALIPGTSRSGITITTGEFLGLKREAAARFSFLLATPISLGAGLYKFVQLTREPSGDSSLWLVALGIIIAFLVGIAVIAWLLDYLKKHSLLVFVIYRYILGSVVILLWLERYISAR